MANFKKRITATTLSKHDMEIGVVNNRKRTKVQEMKEKAAVKRIQKLDEAIKKKDLIARKRNEILVKKTAKVSTLSQIAEVKIDKFAKMAEKKIETATVRKGAGLDKKIETINNSVNKTENNLKKIEVEKQKIDAAIERIYESELDKLLEKMERVKLAETKEKQRLAKLVALVERTEKEQTELVEKREKLLKSEINKNENVVDEKAEFKGKESEPDVEFELVFDEPKCKKRYKLVLPEGHSVELDLNKCFDFASPKMEKLIAKQLKSWHGVKFYVRVAATFDKPTDDLSE